MNFKRVSLLRTGELRFGTDESMFNAILVQRNVPQLKQIFREYESITGHTIETAIENEFSGDVKKGLLAIGTYTMPFNPSNVLFFSYISYF